jgi:large subunit ribosomal protein L23
MKLGRKKKTSAAAPQARAFHYDVILSPVITEKSTRVSEQGKFMFNVHKDANKEAIKSSVEALFGVKVTKVNTLNRLGKVKRFRNTEGKRQDTKKAVVTLAEGQSIDFSSGVKA